MRSMILAFSVIGVLIAGPSHGACAKPETPTCATERGPFPRLADYDECRKLMINYKGGMESYVSCLEESEWPTDGLFARDELESTLARFNRRARGEQD